MIRYVEVVRGSGDAQHAAGTPEAQRRDLDALRTTRPGECVERIDPGVGISGRLTIDKRPDILRLTALIETGKVNELRVVAIDRITRADDLADRLHVLMLCERHRVVIVEAPIGRVIDPSDPMGQMEFLMRATSASQEVDRLIERSASGKARCAAEGRIVGWLGYGHRRLPRAHRSEAPAYDLDPVESLVVVRMYESALNGAGVRMIATTLNDDGVRTSRGSEWSGSRVRDILRNPTYRGKHHHTVRGVGYEVDVPRIVSDETWYAVQATLAGRRRAQGRPGSVPALVRGRAWCGTCGCRLHVRVQSVGVGSGPRYYCPSSTRRNREPPSRPSSRPRFCMLCPCD